MQNTILEELGQRLMTEVRDRSITHWKMVLHNQMKDQESEFVQRVLKGAPECRANLESLIPEIVDTVLHHFPVWLDDEEGADRPEGHFRLVAEFDADMVPSVARISDGLAGELYTDAGWITKFSTY